ncbi:MAG TPA: class I SAM-dependent methyltransferase [Candidatus Portnoybacteria bacterium]|nr:class I SAM-dependent methyltransferase [Candidatus Portnoybacteria bacterium]
MSYYSDKKYKEKSKQKDLWFERLYFDRWFKDNQGPILDIGSATGNFMAVKPEIFEGIEKDKDSVEIARRRGLKVFEMDIEKDINTLPAEKYQGVYAKQVIEHLNDPLNFLKEIKRILKPGGRAVIYTPNCPYMLNKSFWDDYTHKRPFTRPALKRIAYDAGFEKFFVYEDFRCFPRLGGLMRLLHLSPAAVARFQRIFFIRGLSLILVLEKEQ